MEFKSFILVFVIFMISFLSVDALRCFACYGINGEPCFDPANNPNNVTIETCVDLLGPSVCYTYSGRVGNNELVMRGCMSSETLDIWCATVIGWVEDAICVGCEEDLCNA